MNSPVPAADQPAGPLTLEIMREDIARIIALDAQDVGDDDSLIDLGLDSMRMMNLVVRWSQSVAGLEFSDLAEHVTVGQWWQVVERLQAEESA